jgi:hypothetical protein
MKIHFFPFQVRLVNPIRQATSAHHQLPHSRAAHMLGASPQFAAALLCATARSRATSWPCNDSVAALTRRSVASEARARLFRPFSPLPSRACCVCRAVPARWPPHQCTEHLTRRQSTRTVLTDSPFHKP